MLFIMLVNVHRDLKPENLIMTSDDNNADLKIVDFGFAAFDAGGTYYLHTIHLVMLVYTIIKYYSYVRVLGKMFVAKWGLLHTRNKFSHTTSIFQ